MNTPKVAVIVAAKNAERTIKKCVESLLALDYPNYEVIVVDDGSHDQTPHIVESYKDKIKIITLSGVGPSSARNSAVNQAQAEYVAFTDSDCIVEAHWLKALIEGFEESSAHTAACGGIQKLPDDATDFEKKVYLFMKKTGFVTEYMRTAQAKNIIDVEHNPSCNVMYKKEILQREGGFLEGVWPGEDVELDYMLRKKGYRLLFSPQAIVYHYRPQKLSSFLTMMFRYGRVQGFLVRKYGIFRKMHFLPVLTIVFSLLFLSACVWNQSLAFALAISSCFLVLGYSLDFVVAALFLLGGIYWNTGFVKGFLNADTCS